MNISSYLKNREAEWQKNDVSISRDDWNKQYDSKHIGELFAAVTDFESNKKLSEKQKNQLLLAAQISLPGLQNNSKEELSESNSLLTSDEIRSISNNNHSHRLVLNLTENQFKTLKEKSNKAKISIGELIRNLAFPNSNSFRASSDLDYISKKFEPQPDLISKLKDRNKLFVALNRIGTNINQIARKINSGQTTLTAFDIGAFNQLTTELNELIELRPAKNEHSGY